MTCSSALLARTAPRVLALGLLAAAAVPSARAQVLISGIWADTVQTGEPDEAVEVWNPGPSAVDLAGWHLADDDGGDVLLGSLPLAPGERGWVARDAAAFRRASGAPPLAELAGTDPAVPDVSGAWPALANAGDVVILRDDAGAERDVACYGGATPPPSGWTGAPATEGHDPTFTSQLVIARDRTEGSDACEPDTDSAADWDDLRLERPGATHLLPAAWDGPMSARAALGPDATFELLASVLDDATTSLRVAVYELWSVPVAERLRDALARGVAVTLLLEGETVGGTSDQERFLALDLASRGADVLWLRAGADEVKRYPFHHAKYVVADDAVAYVASENFGGTGHPADPTWGNRGWSLRVDDARVAGWLAALFDEDADVRHEDVDPLDPVADAPAPGFVPDDVVPAGWHAALRRVLPADDVVRVTACVSPDHASLERFGVLGLIASATSRLDVQQLSVPTHWGAPSDPPDLHPSALVQAILAAARRGVTTRVLLDASWFSVDPADPRDNDDTCALLNAAAAAEALPLECRLLDPAWLSVRAVHVKGFVVDGRVAHVGSMNGTSNSYRLNREVALQVESPSVAAYFGDELGRDWVVAGVGAVVPAEVTGLRISKDGAGMLRAAWDAPDPAGPSVDGFRVHAGPGVTSEAGWSVAAAAAAAETTTLLSEPAGALAFLLVTAFATGPGGTIEGPSGWGDGWLDR